MSSVGEAVVLCSSAVLVLLVVSSMVLVPIFNSASGTGVVDDNVATSGELVTSCVVTTFSPRSVVVPGSLIAVMV